MVTSISGIDFDFGFKGIEGGREGIEGGREGVFFKTAFSFSKS
jgi:hypothetical protein